MSDSGAPGQRLPRGNRAGVGGCTVNEDDRDLLMRLGSVGIRIGEMVTGLFEDSLSCDEQLAFGDQLSELAEGFRQRVRRTPLVFDAEAT